MKHTHTQQLESVWPVDKCPSSYFPISTLSLSDRARLDSSDLHLFHTLFLNSVHQVAKTVHTLRQHLVFLAQSLYISKYGQKACCSWAVVVSANEATADRPVCVWKWKACFAQMLVQHIEESAVDRRRCQDNACGRGSLAAVSRARGFVF